MANEIAKPMSPMEEFQENLKKSLRDDVARLLPEAALAEMIQRVVNEEFFTKRTVPNPNHSSWNNEPRSFEKPSIFQDMVMKAAAPILEREAAKLVEKLEYKIADQIRETVEAGAVGVVMRTLAEIVNKSFFDSEQRFKQQVVEMLKRSGMNINSY